MRKFLVVALAIAAIGCGDDDGPSNSKDGSVVVDSTVRNDSGMMGNDSGMMGNDSGMMGNDSGMMGGDGGTNAGMCPDFTGSTCNPINNTGCAAGQACNYFNMPEPTTQCGAAGVAKTGEACNQPSDCEAGSACLQNVCRQYCCAGSTMCAAGTGCIADLGGVQVCLPLDNCSPLDVNSCDGGEACIITAEGLTCAPAGAKTKGQACAAANDCVAGLLCVGTSGGATTCLPGCSLMAPMCDGGETCNPLMNIDDIGVCMPAAM